ncbi:MAG: DUF998 domain-containing protein [Candidatus Lokiarchaeota archaeon]|nr:DUF998 domain-containing protein [Candidatus Lokiarchaeota archaeon]
MAPAPRHAVMSFFSGNFSARTFRSYLLAIAAIFGGLVFTSYLLYPGYTFFDYSVSSLGAWHKNPSGWWVFSIAMWAMGIMIVPFFMHVKRVFSRYTPRFARLFEACVLVTAGGMVALGFFPESPGTAPVHYVAAAFIFGGFFVDACISWLSLARMAIVAPTRRKKLFVIACLSSMIAAFWVVLAGMAIMHAISRPAFLASIYFWEWAYLLVSVGLYLLLLEVVVSREPEA